MKEPIWLWKLLSTCTPETSFEKLW